MLKVFDAKYELPHRMHFSTKVMPKLYLDTANKVKVKLSMENTKFTSFTTDLWTSRKCESYMGLTIHFITPTWKLESVYLAAYPLPVDHCGENLAEAIQDAFSDWEICMDNLVVGVTDSASNNSTCFSHLDIPWLTCFGHNLNLAINKALNDERVIRALRIARKAVDAFSRSSKRRRSLREKQGVLGLPQHELIIDVSTRWGSTADMVHRLLEQQQAVCAVFMENRAIWHLNPSDGVYSILECLDEVCFPLLKFTDMFSGETYVTVSSIIPVLSHITDEILGAKDQDKPLVRDLKDVITADLKYQRSV